MASKKVFEEAKKDWVEVAQGVHLISKEVLQSYLQDYEKALYQGAPFYVDVQQEKLLPIYDETDLITLLTEN